MLFHCAAELAMMPNRRLYGRGEPEAERQDKAVTTKDRESPGALS